MNKVKNILYLGWLGQGNVGDDVLFELFKQNFYENLDQSDTIINYNIDGFIPIQNYHYTLESYDLVVLGGGSLFNLPYWLSLCKQAIEWNIPVISWGTGIDGYYTDKDISVPSIIADSRDLLVEVTNNMKYISVRGPLTKKIMVDCGISQSIIHETGDPALIYGDKKLPRKFFKANSKKILVNWGTSNNKVLGGKEGVVQEQLETALQILLNRGYEITIYPIWKDDIPSVIRLGEKFTHNHLRVINKVYDAKRLIELIDDVDLTINLKLHANILSVARRKPFISLAYRGKCFDFAKSINSLDLVIPTSEVHAGEILNSVEEIEKNYQNIVHRFNQAIKNYNYKLHEGMEQIHSLLSQDEHKRFNYKQYTKLITQENDQQKNDNNIYSSRKIFILGSGRSGTHWIGYILEKHPDIYVSIEKPNIFNKVTELALNQNLMKELFPKIVDLYHDEHSKVFPKHFADKSHPNLWIAEQLSEAFPEALFIGIQRNPYGTIASMFKHQGVLFWHYKWAGFPIPNPFLGITKENANEYEQLSLAKKCALRWMSHHKKMEKLKNTLKHRLHVVSYEALITDTQNQLLRIQQFLNLEKTIPMPNVKEQSLDKWKNELTKQDILDIQDITGYDPEMTI